ncbi:hypothetical protein PVK06_048087 [Gossypium arboreum]|uniref:Uncharacterized protein n=1 Tax=Gossypium arboreum TaxID=29729 RepID=A0ABR0MEZ5_GOSAR|nr:hypothetical protein PVK06_048087 [Gossypium arboreum]
MSRGETFPNLHGQLDVTGLAFQIYDAPSWFSFVVASSSYLACLIASSPRVEHLVFTESL